MPKENQAEFAFCSNLPDESSRLLNTLRESLVQIKAICDDGLKKPHIEIFEKERYEAINKIASNAHEQIICSINPK